MQRLSLCPSLSLASSPILPTFRAAPHNISLSACTSVTNAPRGCGRYTEGNMADHHPSKVVMPVESSPGRIAIENHRPFDSSTPVVSALVQGRFGKLSSSS